MAFCTILHEARYTQANEGGSKLPSFLPKNMLCASVPPWLSIVPSEEVCDATGDAMKYRCRPLPKKAFATPAATWANAIHTG